jgi:hemolysin III
MPHSFPQYTLGERWADGVVHVIGVAASVIAAAVLIVLVAQSQPALSVASAGIYGGALIAVFAVSAAYHLTHPGAVKAILRRFDHATIYVKIAATYTPFALVKFAALPGALLLTAVWGIAAFGATAKLFWPAQLVRTSYVLYLAQGWAGVFAFGAIGDALSTRIVVLLLIGGVLYTVGVVFHLWQKLRYHNAIWHSFVLVASGVHFVAIADALALFGAA